MNLFFNRDNDLTGLIKSGRTLSSDTDKQAFLTQVWRLFRTTIEQHAGADMQRMVLVELGYLIRKLPNDYQYFLRNAPAVVVDLIGACRWKRLLLVLPPAEVADRGAVYQGPIRGWLAGIENGPENRSRNLMQGLDPADHDAIAYRTLRAVLAYLKYRPIATFRLSAAGRIELDETIGMPYLTDQLALYVYLFKNKEKAFFLRDTFAYVERWVISEILAQAAFPIPNLEQEAEDITAQAQFDFLRKYDLYTQPGSPFYVDAKLTTYLIGFIKTSRAIPKLLKKYGQRIDTDDAIVDQTTYEEQLTRNQLDTYHQDMNDLFARYVRKLDDKCRQLLTAKFGDGFDIPRPMDTIADLLGETTDALYSRFARCMKHLQKLIDDNQNPGLSPTA